MGNYLSVFYWIQIMEIETRRLLLRPLRDDDAPALASALNNFNVAKNLARVPFPYTIENAKLFIDLQRDFVSPAKFCAITFKCAADEVIGMISYEPTDGTGEIEFGYWLRECCWHMGIMSEASAALVHFAMAQTDIEQLHSGYHIDNPNSGRILRKLGFIETHEEMNFSVAQNKEVSVMKMVLTRTKWQATQ
jgi:RimJ/RimL family protein N-acetyltransferase